MTLPKPLDTSQTRRGLFAAIALAELPMPRTVIFPRGAQNSEASLIFDSISDARPWIDMLSDSHNWRDSNGREDNLSGRGTFAGQPVWVVGSDPAPAPAPVELDEQTRAQLAAITEPAAEPAKLCSAVTRGAGLPYTGRAGHLHLSGRHKCELYGAHEGMGHVCICDHTWPIEPADQQLTEYTAPGGIQSAEHPA